MTCSILLCDDEPEVADQLLESIAPVLTSNYTKQKRPKNDEICRTAKELLARQLAVRDDKKREQQECLFDKADILILDYDLLLIEGNARYTGEGLARLARTFSSCGVIVILNQFRQTHFDLNLCGHLWSYADINLHADLLRTPGLWRAPPWEGFRPWSWHTLHQGVEMQRKRKCFVTENFDSSIAEVFNINDQDIMRLSDSGVGFVAPEAETHDNFRRNTFRDFLQTAMDEKDAKALAERDCGAAMSLIAARIGKWLERKVLGPQDALIDIPHLIQRYPFLLGENAADLEAWNGTIHSPDKLRIHIPEEAWFKPSELLSRPAIWRQRFEADKEISARRSSFDYSTIGSFVFLEDTSEFALLSEAKPFRSGFHNFFDDRFVKRVEGLRYAPQRRFAFTG